MRSLALLLTLAAAIGLPACETIKVTHDADPNADFSRYRSWAWISQEPLIQPQPGQGEMSYVSQIDEQRIRGAVERELRALGLTETAFGKADMIALFAVATEEKMEVHSSPSAGMHHGGRYGAWGASSSLHAYSYTEGTLRIEFFDRATKQAVWVGWASKRLTRTDDAEENINDAVRRILERFPADARGDQ